MKKLLRMLRYLLIVVILSILTYGTFKVEKISSVESFFNRTRGILNTKYTAIGILVIIIAMTIFSIVYVRLHDKENDHRKNM